MFADDELVWGIIKEKLPILGSFCEKLLDSDE